MRAAFRTAFVAMGLLGCGLDRVELMPREEEIAEPEPSDASERWRTSSDAAVDQSSTRVATDSEPDDSEPDDSTLDHSAIELESNPFVGAAELPLATPEKPPGCEKVDFLFVVDNSSSMEDKQAALTRSLPAFIGTLEEVLMIRDFRIMAVDTDGDRLEDLDFPLSQAECDDALGAGRRLDAAGNSCGIVDSRRFLSKAQEDLAGTFACVAAAGDSGSNFERLAEAALTAISEPFNETGGCNEAFLRDDAILVVTWITDEDDERSEDDPPEWRAELLAAKYGQEEAIVPLGLLGPQDDSEESELCDQANLDVEEAPRLHELVSGFPAGYVGDICAEDYSPFFEEAVSKVSWSCERFEPPIIR